MNYFMDAFNIFDLEEFVEIFLEEPGLADDCRGLVADKVYSGKLGDMTARELVEYKDYEIYHIEILKDSCIIQIYIRED